ncbi:MAG: glycoside hydrolase family 65 [Acidobacteriota bacterium]|nr:glycoside hydrolase family 65 [Acidobacteriota bacterium]
MQLSRRGFLAALPASVAAQPAAPIARRGVVVRHNPVLHGIDPRSPLSVGNGEFAFTADPTGLQTFPAPYESALPLCTQAQWGWHTAPGRPPGELRLEPFDTFGRPVGYPTDSRGQSALFNWLRENPHRLHLGRAGFAIERPEDVRFRSQTLDLWTGVLRSEFDWKDRAIAVETACHPAADGIAVKLRGRVPIVFEFPYGTGAMNAADWSHPERHRTEEASRTARRVELARTLDATAYRAAIEWSAPAAWRREAPHRFTLTPEADEFEFTFTFWQGAAPPARTPLFPDFWTRGAAIELPGEARARELERRIVLSQYLTAIQCAGSLPPQETGLACNSWYGKFHLEMHYWHAAHFAAWNRAPLLERSLGWYAAILPSAREKARSQGYAGARWPKMTAPDGRDSPSNIGPLLIWQQPHPIAMAESVYRAAPTRATLERYREVVLESAAFMASYAHYDSAGARYVLGPPLIPAQENHPPRETWNPTFELEYFDYALGLAQRWRERLGMAREPQWDAVCARLSALPVKDGVYLAHENCPQTFTERNRDHPSMLYALGVLPGRKVDREIMRRTLKKVFAEWKWADTWGWDFGAVAMTAASLGETGLAMDALLMDTPKNTFLPNGHNWQRANLPCYLPGNGALLLAVAHMAGRNAFPKEWTVRAEGFAR